MDLITSPVELRAWVAEMRSTRRTIALVPTMGALHEGHLSLIDVARDLADVVVVSAFVNPLQFEDKSDFDRYPLTIEADETMCRERRVDVLYRPDPEAMYPRGFSTSIHIERLSEILEGASRPGHFDGVATVVAKLLVSAEPDVAVFGSKDFQQVALVRRMVTDLGFSVRIVSAPTVREHDGLAMSSRNVRLSDSGRIAARSIPRGLEAALAEFSSGRTDPAVLEATVRSRLVSNSLVSVDYVHVVDPVTLAPVVSAEPGHVVLVAAIVDGVRLIDNAELGTTLFQFR